MDVDEWELLSDEGFIDLHEDHGVSTIPPKPNSNRTTMIDMDYFQKLDQPQKKRNNSTVIFPVQIKFDQDEEIPAQEVTKLPIESSQPEDQNFGVVLGPKSDDYEMFSKVFFKKLKEKNELVDMKMDSPKSLHRGVLPQLDEKEKDGNFEMGNQEDDEKPVLVEDLNLKSAKMDDHDHKDEGLNVWKWATTGVGAIINFGFAAATVSFVVFSNRHKEPHISKNKELHFQIYSHGKRFKQVVHHATKLNEAITVMRGAPITRAHIKIGGYYEGL